MSHTLPQHQHHHYVLRVTLSPSGFIVHQQQVNPAPFPQQQTQPLPAQQPMTRHRKDILQAVPAAPPACTCMRLLSEYKPQPAEAALTEP
jgi:hypothetical protein